MSDEKKYDRVFYCNRRTYKGGQGINDASGVREWACGKEPDHEGVCDYTRDLGVPVARW